MFLPDTVSVDKTETMRLINQIVTENDTTLWPGITRVNVLFRNNQHASTFTPLWTASGQTYVNENYDRQTLNNLVNNQHIASTIVDLDWFQTFALCHVPLGIWPIFDRQVNAGGLTPMMYVRLYDDICLAAYETYVLSVRSNNWYQQYQSLESTMNEAKTFIRDQTISHDGCDTGKRQFLAGTGLWDEDEVDEMFEREYYVNVNVSIAVSVPVTVPGGQDVDDYINDTMDNDMIRDAVSSTSSYDWDCEVSDWEEA
jgi:hypothetical protein